MFKHKSQWLYRFRTLYLKVYLRPISEARCFPPNAEVFSCIRFVKRCMQILSTTRNNRIVRGLLNSMYFFYRAVVCLCIRTDNWVDRDYGPGMTECLLQQKKSTHDCIFVIKTGLSVFVSWSKSGRDKRFTFPDGVRLLGVVNWFLPPKQKIT